MYRFAVEIWYDEGSVCTFYSVRFIDEKEDTLSETDKFFDKFTREGSHFYDEAMQLFRLVINSIGDKYGAIDDFFDRMENRAQALPPRPKKGVDEISLLGLRFPLRLFCFRVSEQIVILFNGGVKSSENVQSSDDLSVKFYEAQFFALRIIEALREKIIEISDNGRYLEYFDNNDIIL